MGRLLMLVVSLITLFYNCPKAVSQQCNSYINITSSSLLSLAGEDVCFRCFFDEPGVIDNGTQWTTGNPAEAIPPEDGSVVDGVLIIFDLADVFDQSLTFLTCRAGDGGAFYQIAVSLDTFVAPTIDGLTVINETDTLVLTCDTSQSSPAPSITWLDPNGNEILIVGVLVIENMNRSDAGVYTCLIRDTTDQQALSTNVTVQVQYAPDVTTIISSPHLSPRGQPLTLSCDYDSVPPPDITWLFEGIAFSESDPRVAIVSNETHSDFTLSDLMEDEAGLYVCAASNLLGMTTVEITVTVQVQMCPILTDPANGQVNVPSRTVNSTATYSCDEGYILDGTATRQCQQAQDPGDPPIWSGSEPTCIVAPLAFIDGSPTVAANGTVSVSFSLVDGSNVRYRCVIRRLTPPRMRIRIPCSDGTFTADLTSGRYNVQVACRPRGRPVTRLSIRRLITVP